MQGRRRADHTSRHAFEPGDYGVFGASWYARTPNGLTVDLAGHAIEVHGDGTITVSPAIRAGSGDRSWHGHLEAGRWSEC